MMIQQAGVLLVSEHEAGVYSVTSNRDCRACSMDPTSPPSPLDYTLDLLLNFTLPSRRRRPQPKSSRNVLHMRFRSPCLRLHAVASPPL